MDRPPPPSGDYWYLGSQDGAVDALFRRVCALAWPYALLCATRYLHDVQAAYDLMDAAVSNAEEYYERFNGNRTFSQIFHRVLSVLKRSSKQRALNSREVPSGSLPDLERKAHALTSKPEAEQTAYVRQLLAQMTVRSRKITIWRTEGHTGQANEALQHVSNPALRGRYYQLLTARGAVYQDMGDLDRAATDYNEALADAKQLDYWRGMVEVGGYLARTEERQEKLTLALSSIDAAINANKNIPDEL